MEWGEKPLSAGFNHIFLALSFPWMLMARWILLRKVRNGEMDHSFTPRIQERLSVSLYPTTVHMYTNPLGYVQGLKPHLNFSCWQVADA